MAEDEEGLRSLRRLWGEAGSSPRGRPARLTLSDVVTAGLRLADEAGLEAVTMSAVADRLDSAPMTLYRHVASKDELVTLLEDAGVAEVPQIDLPAELWRQALTSWSDRLASLFVRRPWLLDAPTQGPPAGPNQLAWLEVALHALRGFPVAGPHKIALVTLLSGHVRQTSALERDLVRARERRGQSARQVDEQWGRFLAGRLTPSAYPALLGALADGDGSDMADMPGFGRGLVLDAIAQLAPREWSSHR